MRFDLKSFRKDFKLKQSELANILRIGQSFISEIETDKVPFPEIHYETLKEKYSEEALQAYISGKTGDVNVKGDNNTSNTGLIDGYIIGGNSDLMKKIVDLEKEVIKLQGELATKDATITGLNNELAFKTEMITFLQNKK